MKRHRAVCFSPAGGVQLACVQCPMEEKMAGVCVHVREAVVDGCAHALGLRMEHDMVAGGHADRRWQVGVRGRHQWLGVPARGGQRMRQWEWEWEMQ